LTANSALHFRFLEIPEILNFEFRDGFVVDNENSRLSFRKNIETAKWRPDYRLLAISCPFHPALKPAETVGSP